MISRISGILEACQGPVIHVRLPGIGITRELHIPAYLAQALQTAVGQDCEFLTLEYLESVSQGASFIPRMVGFATPEDKRLFELLTDVKGIGTRKALRVMAREPAIIMHWIASQDVESLTLLPEVGKKLATTIVNELAGRVSAPGELGRIVVTIGAGGPGIPPAADEAVGALMALGDTRAEAEARVRRVLAREGSLRDTDEILQAALAGPAA